MMRKRLLFPCAMLYNLHKGITIYHYIASMEVSYERSTVCMAGDFRHRGGIHR